MSNIDASWHKVALFASAKEDPTNFLAEGYLDTLSLTHGEHYLFRFRPETREEALALKGRLDDFLDYPRRLCFAPIHASGQYDTFDCDRIALSQQVEVADDNTASVVFEYLEP